MHNYILFCITLFSVCYNIHPSDREIIELPVPQHIVNDKTNVEAIHLWKKYASSYPDIGVPSWGEKLFSNVCNEKIFTIIDCSTKAERPYCHTSLLNLATNIDRPYEALPMRATACHLLDAQTPVVGYHKLFFLHETLNILRCMKNIYQQPRTYTLEIAQTLNPILVDDDQQKPGNNVHIITIDSCDTHLLVISSNGFITTWEKNGKSFHNNSRQKGYCNQPFFSAGFNKKEKVICLGLNNGKIFVTNVMSLADAKIIDLFPQQIKINWISVSEINFLCAGICATKKEILEKQKSYYPARKTSCCKKAVFKPEACSNCKLEYQREAKSKQLQCLGTIDQIRNMFAEIEQKVVNKCNEYCEHAQQERNRSTLPEICNSCRKTFFYAIVSASSLLRKEITPVKIREYQKENDQCIMGFHLIHNEDVVLSYEETVRHRKNVLLKSLKSGNNIDFRTNSDKLEAASSFTFIQRESGYFSILSDWYQFVLHSTNKPHNKSIIQKIICHLRRKIGRMPYWQAPWVIPIQLIFDFVMTPKLSAPSGLLLCLLYYKSHPENI